MNEPRTVHFPPAAESLNGAKSPPAAVLAKLAEKPALLVYGELQSDLQVFARELKALPSAETDYHGSLQVLKSVAKRLEQNVQRLLNDYQAGV
jgi:hypothetical protein